MFSLKLNRNRFVTIFKDVVSLKTKQKFRGKRLGYLLSFMLLMFSQISQAQCAMCRAVLESEENIAIAEGVNNGIVYLMAIPYILVGILFYFVYRKMTS